MQIRPRLTRQEYQLILNHRKKTNTVNVGGFNNVLVIGDLHEPFTRYGYRDFCLEIYHKYNCDGVVFIADLIDNHFSSFHDADPDGHSAGKELELAKENIKKWHDVFPDALVTIGNHDAIPVRKAFNAGLSKSWIRNIGEVLDTPTWTYGEEFIINDVMYTHGTGRKARQRCRQDVISVVQGHYHSESYIEYYVGKQKVMFAMQIGCGIHDKAYAFAYGKHFSKSHINCGVVLDKGRYGVIEYMQL
jgi:hypothetical protein